MALELLLIAIGLLCLHHYMRTRGLPPGPLSVPLLGTLDLFTNYSGSATSIIFSEKYFGFKELCTIFLGPSLVLVLINDFKLAKELFVKEEFSGQCCTSCKITCLKFSNSFANFRKTQALLARTRQRLSRSKSGHRQWRWTKMDRTEAICLEAFEGSWIWHQVT